MKLTPSRREPPVSEQAAAWLAILSDEACTQEERRHFAHWLTRSNLHVDEFLRISALTRRLERSQAWPDVDIDQLVAQARSETKVAALSAKFRFQQREAPSHSPLRSLSPRAGRLGWGVRVATAATVLAVTALLAVQAPRWWHDRHTYETRLGELRSVTLEDGSIVELNAKSSIRARFTPNERHLDLLSGEAVFRVAQNHQRPFKVSTPFADIIAVGTQFNVDSRSNKTIVTVIEGKVRVEHRSQRSASDRMAPLLEQEREKPAKRDEVFLTTGQQAVVQPERATQQIARADPAKVTSWTTRRLYFEDTPLSEAASEFERYSPRRIRIDDSTLADRRITGTFDSFDPAALVKFLARYGDAAIVETDNGWTVSRADSPPASQ